MSSYPHGLRIFERGPGEHGADDVYREGNKLTIYDDEADVQDGPFELERDGDGRPTVRAEAVAFLKDESEIDLIELEMFVEVDWNDGSYSEAAVVGIRKLDGQLLLDWRKR